MSERPTDALDQAALLTEEITQRSIAEARAKAQHRELKPCGRCHWCEERIGPGLIFCEGEPFEPSECAEDWHRDQAAKKRSGAPRL